MQVIQIDIGYRYKIVFHSDRYWYFWEVEKPTEGETYVRSQHNNVQCLQCWYRPVRMHNTVHILWQHGDRFSQPGVCLRQQQAPRATRVHAVQSQASYMNPYIIVKSYLVSTASIFYCISSFICLSLLYAYLPFFVRCCSWLFVHQKYTNLPSK